MIAILLAACAEPEDDVAPTPGRPGSPFFDAGASRTVSSDGGFVPAAVGLGATFGVDGGALGPWRTTDGEAADPSVSLHLFDWSYLDNNDPTGWCTVTYPLDAGDAWSARYDYAAFTTGATGPWTTHGFEVTLDATDATTSCPGLDAAWGDAVGLLDGVTLGLGVTPANDDVLAALVPGQVDLTRHAGAAVRWALFSRYTALTSDTYQLGMSRYYEDGRVTPGAEVPFSGDALPDGGYAVDPVLLLAAEALLDVAP